VFERGCPGFVVAPVGFISTFSLLARCSITTPWSKKYKADEELTCSLCNRKKLIGTFTEKPLPFYIADKPMFFQNADPRHAAKSFPVCDNCYLELHKGIQFIQNKLDYRLSSVQSIQKSEINFWLIPHLNDNEPVS
jgi:CRISPR-associated protein Csh1